MLKFISGLFLQRMGYQTGLLDVGKSSTTFDEDAELKGTKQEMKAVEQEHNRDVMNVSMDGNTDYTAEQIGTSTPVVLFCGTNKHIKFNSSFPPFSDHQTLLFFMILIQNHLQPTLQRSRCFFHTVG